MSSSLQAIDTVYVDKVINDRSLSQVVSEYDNAHTILILESRIYVTSQIKIKRGVKMLSRNGSVISPNPNSKMSSLINASGPLGLDNIILNGDHKIAWGIYTTASLEVINSTIENLYGGPKVPASGIRHVPKDSKHKLIVRNSVFRDISSFEDGIVGNYVGATRGVLSFGGDVLIRDNTFSNIQGKEDADGIHILTKKSDSLGWVSAGQVEISHNNFIDFGKRAIKIQASDVHVYANEVYVEEAKVYAAISVYGSKNTIANNTIDIANATAGITITSGIGNLIENNTINLLRVLPENKVWGIVLNQETNAKIIDNKIQTRGRYFPIYLTKFKLDHSKELFQQNNQILINKI